MAYIFKIKYEGTLRRVNVPYRYDSSAPDLTFDELQTKIREMFRISPMAQFLITYTDMENDIVTMGDNQDLEDACVLQGLNPLRLDVKVIDGKQRAQVDSEMSPNAGTEQTGPSFPQASEFTKSATELATELAAALKRILPEVTTETVESVKRLLCAYEPWIRAAVPPKMILEEVENLLKVLTGQAREGQAYEPPACDKNRSSDATKGCCNGGTTPMQPGPMPSFGGKRERKGVCEPETFGRIIHRGIECDGCGMTPIIGPRFKSMKKDDFDLCSSCFAEIGDESEYQRIDRPIHSRRAFYHHPCGARMMRHPMGPPPPPFISRGAYGWNGWKPYFPVRGSAPANVNAGGEQISGKLDARFVQDVTIFDGTELPPHARFTKIWRLRNIGTLPWPQQTQLVHVGGDVLCSDVAANLELPEQGLPCDEEIEASVDLVAPDRPGRYVSHWRLMAPSGQKFGHRVWALIQVVPQDEQSPQVQESLLPQQAVTDDKIEENALMDVEENALMDEDPVRHEVPATEILNKDSGSSEDSIIGASTLIVDSISQPGQKKVEDAPSMVISELGGFSMVEKPVEDRDGFPIRQAESQLKDGYAFIEDLADMTLSSENVSARRLESSPILQSAVVEKQPTVSFAPLSDSTVNVDIHANVQDALLEKLESMGFTQRTLNLELLKKNHNNLQDTVDNLVAVSEWDPILKELEEMGFYDTEMNRSLMLKNNGSMKRVVKELVQMHTSSNKGKEKAL